MVLFVARTLPRAACTVLVMVVGMSWVARQPTHAQESREQHDFATWVDAVNTHVPGGVDEPLTRIAPWSRGQLESLLSQVSRQRIADRLRIVERALVLHTDIAITHRVSGGYRDLPAALDAATLFRDGQVMGQAAGTFHWEFARRLLQRLPRGEDRLHLGRQFYRASAAVLQLWMEYSELHPHLAAAGRVIGDDAVLLMYEGAMCQAYAGSRMQRFFNDQERAALAAASAATAAGVRSIRSIIPAATTRPTAEDLRAQAERLFRRAIEMDPELAEARIRLAHVLTDLGRHDAAADELARAFGTPLPPMLDYYGSLILGRAARARDDFDAARLAFERAAAIYRAAPAPLYGLSELAAARGDRVRGQEYLLRIITSERTVQSDPWWLLDRVHSPSAHDLIDEMRRSVMP